MKVLVGSKNPVKIQGAKEAFGFYFEDVEVMGISVASGVSEQPINIETYQGAKNRSLALMEYAKKNGIDADYFASVESGMINSVGDWVITNVAVIIDKNGKESMGTSAGFPVPKRLVDEIKEKSLGYVMGKLSGDNEISKKYGGVFFLTRKITRDDLSRDAFVMALAKFVNGDTWCD